MRRISDIKIIRLGTDEATNLCQNGYDLHSVVADPTLTAHGIHNAIYGVFVKYHHINDLVIEDILTKINQINKNVSDLITAVNDVEDTLNDKDDKNPIG